MGGMGNIENSGELSKLAQFLHTLNYQVLELRKDVVEVEESHKLTTGSLSAADKRVERLAIYSDTTRTSLKDQGVRIGQLEATLVEIRTQLKIAWWICGISFTAATVAVAEVFFAKG